VRSGAIEGLTAADKLPSFYGEDRLVLLSRDSYWLFAYWEVTPAARQQLEKEGQRPWEHLNLALRVRRYNTSMEKEEGCIHIPINHEADSWYIEAGVPDRSYQVDLGGQIPGKGFVSLLSSNIARTPRDDISSVIDENWYLPDWQTRRLYRRINRGSLSSLEMAVRGSGTNRERRK